MPLKLTKPTKGMQDWDVPMNENLDDIMEYADGVDKELAEHTHAASDVGAATANHTHTASDVGAAAANHTHAASDVGAAASDHTHAAQTSVTGNAGTATTLQTTRAIDGVNFNGSAAITHYASCSTAAATAAKTASITGFTLATGARVTIKFTNTNTAAAPTLNITSTGAKDMYYRGAKITAAAPTLQGNGVYDFIYNGTAYDIIGNFGGGYGC